MAPSMRSPFVRPIAEPVGRKASLMVGAPPTGGGGGGAAPANALSLGASNLLYLGSPDESGYTNVLTLGP